MGREQLLLDVGYGLAESLPSGAVIAAPDSARRRVGLKTICGNRRTCALNLSPVYGSVAMQKPAANWPGHPRLRLSIAAIVSGMICQIRWWIAFAGS